MRNLIPWLTPNTTRAFYTISLSLALLLIGCLKPDEQRHAGVDDFPNSIHAQMQGFLDESKKSEDVGLVPTVTDSILGLQGFNVGAAKTAVGKVSAASKVSARMMFSSLAGASIDSCTGTLKFDTTITTPTKATHNSLVLCIDGRLTDSIKGNETVLSGMTETVFTNGRVERAEVSDADGDSILNTRPNGGSKARMVLTVTEAGTVEKTTLVVGPGEDNIFDTEADNIVFQVGWNKTKNAGKDTLGSATYTDADADGSVLDNTKPSMVDLVLYEKGATKDHPDAIWSRATMRLIIRFGVKAQEAKRVRFEMETTDGQHQLAEILNLDLGRDFEMGGTVKSHFLSVYTAAKDTVDTMDVYLTMKVGADLNDKSDDSVKVVDVRVKKKLGEEKSAHFTFTSDHPIPSGRDPQSGKLSMKVEYTDATTVDADGTLSDKGMDMTIKTREDKHLHVVWDPLGRGVSLEEIH